MMHFNEICKAFDVTNKVYSTFTSDYLYGITLPVSGHIDYNVLYTYDLNKEYISVRVYDFVKFTDEQRQDILQVVSELNSIYAFVKFSVTDESVHIGYDFLISAENIGESAVELLDRIVSIAEESYPRLLRVFE